MWCMENEGWIPIRAMEGTHPTWEPILDVLGEQLAARFFMWMFVAVLDDGTRVHSFKNSITRRYLFLDESGRGFEWQQGRGHRQRPLPGLVESAFEGMGAEHWREDDLEAFDDALRRAREDRTD